MSEMMKEAAKPARAPSEEATSDYWSLVNRLRRAAAPRHDPLQETDLYTEAAAEIERLSTALLNPSEEVVTAVAVAIGGKYSGVDLVRKRAKDALRAAAMKMAI